jgi:D-alanine-D-alanine ligase
MPGKYHHVAVLMGGLSAEREVSLRSGDNCARALEGEGYRVTRIDVGRDVAERLREVAPDVCFNALHGRWGEDGCMQGVLELMGIPYTHSGVLASSVAMNKEMTKAIVARAGVPVAEGRVVSRAEAAKGHVMAPPYVLKPVSEGSSVGIFMVLGEQGHPGASLLQAGAPDDAILAERYIEGREFTCAVLGDRPLAVTEIKPAEGYDFYDYDSKYKAGGSIHIIPAPLLPDVNELVQSYSLKAHRSLGCRGVSRSDFRYDEGTGALYFLEINTQPGMTATSLVPEQAQHVGMTSGELVRWLVEDASCNR